MCDVISCSHPHSVFYHIAPSFGQQRTNPVINVIVQHYWQMVIMGTTIQLHHQSTGYCYLTSFKVGFLTHWFVLLPTGVQYQVGLLFHANLFFVVQSEMSGFPFQVVVLNVVPVVLGHHGLIPDCIPVGLFKREVTWPCTNMFPGPFSFSIFACGIVWVNSPQQVVST